MNRRHIGKIGGDFNALQSILQVSKQENSQDGRTDSYQLWLENKQIVRLYHNYRFLSVRDGKR